MVNVIDDTVQILLYYIILNYIPLMPSEDGLQIV